jgi:TonB family protein
MQIFRLFLLVFCFAWSASLFAQAKDSAGVIIADKIVTVAETIPAFSYHGKGISEFIIDNLNYPKSAVENGIEAKIVVDFVVDTSGRVVNVTSREDGNARLQALVDEAIRVIKASSGYWKPGYTNGKKVRVKMRIPITYKLE